jgi:hypothetical protein
MEGVGGGGSSGGAAGQDRTAGAPRRVRRVRVAAAVVAGFAVLLGAASVAFACSNLATISTSAESGHTGDTITLIGTSFPVPRSAGSAPTSVVIHWGAIDGPVVATVVPDRTGTISATFTVPPSQPGNVVILAVQRRGIPDPNGPADAPPKFFVDEPGTPARATFRVLAAGETAVPSPIGSDDFVGAGTDDGGTATVVLMVLFGAVSLSLFAGGVIAFLHQVGSKRTSARAQPWRLPY